VPGSPSRRASSKRALSTAVELPLLPRRDTVVFPETVAQLAVMRASSLRAIEAAVKGDHRIVIVARRNPEATEVAAGDLHRIGTEAVIGRVVKMPDGTTSLWLQGQRRVVVERVVAQEPYFRVLVTPQKEEPARGRDVEALKRNVLKLYKGCVELSPNLAEEQYVAALNIDHPGPLADFIVSTLRLELAQKQHFLDLLDPRERLSQLHQLLAKELDVLQLQGKIHSKVQEEMDKSHREFFLREQLKAIQSELSGVDPQTREVKELRERVEAAGMPEPVKKKALEEVERLATIPTASPEVSVIRTYVDWLLALPWSKETEDNLDIKQAARVLDENHYGLGKIKERILEYMAVRKLAQGNLRSPILCFVGAPGVGKTSLGKSIAQALGRSFVRVSLGGIRDEAEIRGHRRTYIGALPGRVIQTMRNAGTVNPVFMLDEVDKVGTDFRGDPSAALLEVLDPEQNHSFSDHYLDVPYSLSKVLFIATANVLDPVLPALRDRMEVIELPGYIEEEKVHIAQGFLVPRQLKEHGLADKPLQFSEAALVRIIREHTREAGVRNLERELGTICRKVARQVAEGREPPRQVGVQAVVKYLGPQQFFWGAAEEQDEIGVAMGVARTEQGGDVLGVEVTLMEGKGNLILTGQLGDVMKESATAAVSYARSRAAQLGIGVSFDKLDIHIHVPAGATPKDGPSAGITMATALISALTRRAVRRDVAMTGEITLRGRVLPVGGVKEKVLAVHRAGIRTFVLPAKNRKDLEEIPKDVRREMQFVPVDGMERVLEVALKDRVEAALVAVSASG